MPPESFVCKPIGPQNLAEEPPPIWSLKAETSRETESIREFADLNKLAEQPCSSGKVAYPLSLGKDAPKAYPVLPEKMPATGNAGTTRIANPLVPGFPTTMVPDALYHVAAMSSTIRIGAAIDLNVAAPEIEEAGLSHSIGQINMSGPEGSGYTVELGWRANRWWEGTRLFTFVNKDNYAPGGAPRGHCYNCHFVPLAGADYVMGQELIPSGPPFNTQTLRFGLFLWETNWWVWVGDQWIGYLDGDFWSDNFLYSGEHLFYGEVYNGEDAEGDTDMGNGSWASSSSASIMRNPTSTTYKNGSFRHLDESLHDPLMQFWPTNPNFYTGMDVSQDGRTWRFGGPGSN